MNNAEQDYEEYVDDSVLRTDKFTVTDESSANWCVKKIAKCDERIENVKKFVANEKLRLDNYLDKMVEEEMQTRHYMESLLMPYAQETLKFSKQKSMKLLEGTIGFHKCQPKIEKDEAALMTFVETSLPEFVKVKKSVNWADLKKECVMTGDKMVTKDGEIVEGVKVLPAEPDTFYVKAGGL